MDVYKYWWDDATNQSIPLLMERAQERKTIDQSSSASDVYKNQGERDTGCHYDRYPDAISGRSGVN